jgi:hypothetical protein
MEQKREREERNGDDRVFWVSDEGCVWKAPVNGGAVAVGRVPAGASPFATSVRCGEGRTK